MIKLLRRFFRKKPEKNEGKVLHLFAVETNVVLDNGFKLDTFTATIHAESKKDAKERVMKRARIKGGHVVNKRGIARHIEKHRKAKLNGNTNPSANGHVEN